MKSPHDTLHLATYHQFHLVFTTHAFFVLRFQFHLGKRTTCADVLRQNATRHETDAAIL